jgi:superfamily II DNA helicase RecQ
MKEIVHELKKGIIYVSTRKRVVQVLDLLRDWGVEKCEGYHAGMSDVKRDAAQVRSPVCDIAACCAKLNVVCRVFDRRGTCLANAT